MKFKNCDKVKVINAKDPLYISTSGSGMEKCIGNVYPIQRVDNRDGTYYVNGWWWNEQSLVLVNEFEKGEMIEVSDCTETPLKWINRKFIDYTSKGDVVCENEEGDVYNWKYGRKIKEVKTYNTYQHTRQSEYFQTALSSNSINTDDWKLVNTFTI